MDLTDEQWCLVAPLLPAPPPGTRGRPRLDRRRILNGILWKLRHGLPWHRVPARYASHQACYHHYRRWVRDGVLLKIIAALMRDLERRGALNLDAALASGVVHISDGSPRHVISLAAPLLDTWQGSTAVLICQVVAQFVEASRLDRS